MSQTALARMGGSYNSCRSQDTGRRIDVVPSRDATTLRTDAITPIHGNNCHNGNQPPENVPICFNKKSANSCQRNRQQGKKRPKNDKLCCYVDSDGHMKNVKSKLDLCTDLCSDLSTDFCAPFPRVASEGPSISGRVPQGQNVLCKRGQVVNKLAPRNKKSCDTPPRSRVVPRLTSPSARGAQGPTSANQSSVGSSYTLLLPPRRKAWHP
jgi:hypothetical protein